MLTHKLGKTTRLISRALNWLYESYMDLHMTLCLLLSLSGKSYCAEQESLVILVHSTLASQVLVMKEAKWTKS